MGCDIHGWIEVNRFPTREDPDSEFAWESAVWLDKVLCRSYTMFGRLAHDGSRQKFGDIALFAGRGLPDRDNLGRKTRENYEQKWEMDAHHQTHFTHAELTQSRIRVDVANGTSEEVVPIEYLREGLEDAYKEWQDDEGYNAHMAYGRKRRAWESAFNISEALAEANGHEQVRWVIWFDN